MTRVRVVLALAGYLTLMGVLFVAANGVPW